MSKRWKAIGTVALVMAAEAILALLLIDAGRRFQPRPDDIKIRDLGFRVTEIQEWPRKKSRTGDAFLQRTDVATIGWGPIQFLCASPFGSEASILKLNFHWHIIVPSGSAISPVVDTNPGAGPEIPMIYPMSRHIIFEWRDMKSRTVRKMALPDPSSPIPTDKISLNFFRIEDLDGDGRLEIFLAIEAGFYGQPRGLLVYDLATGAKKWEFLTAGVPFQAEVGDYNEDGKKEILLSAWASHNGVIYKDMDDDHSSLLMLDGAGNQIWHDVLSGYFSEIRFAAGDINGDGRTEIVTARSCHRADNPDPGEINIIDARSGSILQTFRQIGVSFTKPFIVPLGAGHERGIVVGDSGGNLNLFDSQLKLLKAVNFTRRANVLGLFLPRSGALPLIVADANGSKLLVMNTDLRILLEKDYQDFGASPPTMIALSDGQNEHAVVNADHMYMLTYQGTTWRHRWAAVLGTPFAGLLAIAVAFNLALAYALCARRRHLRLVQAAAAREENHDWTSTVQEIVHGMKTPLFTVQLEAEKLAALNANSTGASASPEAAHISESILDDVKTLGRQTRLLMQLVSIPSAILKPGDVNTLLRRIGEKYRDIFRNRVEFVLDLSDGELIFPFNEGQLQEVFSNLIDNAIDSLPKGGRVRLASHPFRRPRQEPPGMILIEIEDNGSGIPADLLDRIFDSSFSTKPNGLGLGLPIAKRIVDKHGGSIEIHSKEGIGTRIAIYFPWKGR
jgi:signal transduction histidine kinase